MDYLQKRKLNRGLLLAWVISIVVAVLIVLRSVSIYTNGLVIHTHSSWFFLSLWVLVMYYLLIAIQPKRLAKLIVEHIRRDYYRENTIDIQIFWNILKKIRWWETGIDIFLVLWAVIQGGVLVWILHGWGFFSYSVAVIQNTPNIMHDRVFQEFGVPFVLAGVMLLMISLQSLRSRKITLKTKKTPKKVTDIFKTLCIRMGFKSKTGLQILDTNIPNAFSIKKKDAYTITLTQGLLDVLETKHELEGVLAHEIAHCQANYSSDLRVMNVLFSILKVESWLLFIFLLALFSTQLLIVWFFVLVFLVITQNKSIKPENSWHDLVIVFSVVNPLYAFVNFFYEIILYILTYNEDFYADLMAVKATRYPKGLYMALQKLRDVTFETAEVNLPEHINPLYFVAEHSNQMQSLAVQPSITNRLLLLDDLDSELRKKNKS